MRYLGAFLICLLTAVTRADEVRIAAAASLKDAFGEITATFGKSTGHTATPTFGASGMLLAQIKAGMPVDVFISAGQMQMDELVAAKKALSADVCVIAGNDLVVIVPADAEVSPASLAALTDPHFARIAIGTPATVPAGQYAAESLTTAKLDEVLKPKFIFGSNVRQVLDYVSRGEVDAGFVYSTDVRDAGANTRIAFTVDPKLHSPILYPAVVVADSAHHQAAQLFCQFLVSPPAQKTLRSHGFAAPPPSPTAVASPARADAPHS